VLPWRRRRGNSAADRASADVTTDGVGDGGMPTLDRLTRAPAAQNAARSPPSPLAALR
jgi:hypothetical protein